MFCYVFALTMVIVRLNTLASGKLQHQRKLQTIKPGYNYKLEYQVNDFLKKCPQVEYNGTVSLCEANKVRIGLLDSGISKQFSERHPMITLKDFTNDKDLYDSTGHGTFSMSVG